MEEMQEALKGREIIILNLQPNNKYTNNTQLNLKHAILSFSHIYIQYLDYINSKFSSALKYKLFCNTYKWFGIDIKNINPAYIIALTIT